MAYLTSGKKKLLGSNTEGKGINIWQPNTEYKLNDLCLYKETNYYSLYICTTEHTSDVDFDETNWEQLTYGIDELSKEDVEGLLGLTKEEIEAMADLILDTEVRIDKTYSSSKIYTDIQQCLEDSKTFTLLELGKFSGANYKVVASTSEMTSKSIIYLLANGNTYDVYIVEENGATTKIGNTQIDLSNYYTKTEIDKDFLKKVDADGKYATITTLTTHTNDADIHVTTADKTKWDKVTDKLDVADFNTHKNNTDIHITSVERTKWDKVDEKVDKTDIVDNLTSTDTDKPLSANQGMLLKSMIVTLPGVVLPYAGNSEPTGFLLCNGQAVSRTKYRNLFDVIGTTYGKGNGSTTFNLPNLQGKFIQGAGTNAVGTEMSAGLPNITGVLRLHGAEAPSIISNLSGAFASENQHNDYRSCIELSLRKPETTEAKSYGDFKFNASNSNSIYGNSDTVQPPAILMNYIIKY